MGRKLQTTLPTHPSVLIPTANGLNEFRKEDMKCKAAQKKNYDKIHRAQAQPVLSFGDNVWVRNQDSRIPGIIAAKSTTPRSYIVDTEKGKLRRNARHLTKVSGKIHDESKSSDSDDEPEGLMDDGKEQNYQTNPDSNARSPAKPRNVTVTRSGRESRAPNRLDI